MPTESLNGLVPDLAEVNTHVALTVGVNLNQSLSPLASIEPLTPVAQVDGQPQLDDVEDPQSSRTACDTVIVLVCVGLPTVVVKVNVAERADVVVFAAAVRVMFWFPVPVFVLWVNQSADEDTLQLVLEVTDVEVDAPVAAGDHDDRPRLNVAPAPACETTIVMARVGLPAVVAKVSVAERADTAVFAAAVTVTVWLPLPELVLVVNQPADDDTLQVVFDASDVEVDPPPAAGDHEDEPRVSAGATPACDTDIVLVCAGLPLVVVNVSVAERAPVAVFAAAVKVKV